MSTEPQMPPTNLALSVPADILEMVKGADKFEIEANNFVVDSEATFQLADEIQDTLKSQAKAIEDKRKKDFTGPLDALKKNWMAFFAPSVDGRTKAVQILQGKMSGFRRQEREKAEAAQREAEALARKERERLEAEARKREADAAKLKTEAGRENALRDAENLRQTAQMVPETFAVSAPVPQTTASNVAQTWKGEVSSKAEALAWLVSHPEWFSIVDFKQAEVNRLAKQYGEAKQTVPGFSFYQADSFRAKGR